MIPPALGADYNKPRSRARSTAARRLVAPSLVKMCFVWLLSVLRETNSSRAISGPVSSLSSRRRTCSSRSLSASADEPGLPGGPDCREACSG